MALNHVTIITYRVKGTSEVKTAEYHSAAEALAVADRHITKRKPGKPDGTFYNDYRDPIVQRGDWDYWTVHHVARNEFGQAVKI